MMREIFKKLSWLLPVTLAAACGNSNSDALLKDASECKYGVRVKKDNSSTLNFHAASFPKRTNMCPLPANLVLCSEEPIKSTDGGYEVKLLPLRNKAFKEWSETQNNDCTLINLIAWKELNSNVTGKEVQVIGPLITPTPAPIAIPRPLPVPSNAAGNLMTTRRIFNEALRWPKQYFKAGEEAQCANFVREILATSCNRNFKPESGSVIQSYSPWDVGVLGNAALSPGYANSLAGPEVGTRISISEARPGDLVFFRNTYGNWPYGTITHVGVYAGDNLMIDRPTFSGPVLYRSVKNNLLVGALRVHQTLCKN